MRSPFKARTRRALFIAGVRFALACVMCAPWAAGAQDDADSGSDDDRELDFLAQVRVRPELRDQSDFDETIPDRERFFGQRTRVGLDATVSPKVGGRVLVQDTRNWGTQDSLTTSTGDDDQALDLFEGYLDLRWIWDLPLDLRFGRQTMRYGRERLVGDLDFSNFARTFDAFRFRYLMGAIGIDIFSAKLVDTNPPFGSGLSDQDRNFSGAYFRREGDRVEDAEVYWLRDIDKTFAADHLETKRHTFGTRAKVLLGAGLAIEGEYSYQSGSSGVEDSLDIGAQAFAAELLWEKDSELKPRAALGIDWATGDEDLGDEDLGTFNQLFPNSHPFLGTLDYVGRQNIQSVHVSGGLRFWRQLSGEVAYHGFRLDEAQDAWYDANGFAKLPVDPLRTHRTLGGELDLLFSWSGIERTLIEGGYSHFFPGRVIEDAIAEEADSDWAYFQIRVDL
jgi:Alginate export